jgi:V8-like Glu-specific endopeptidase
MTRVALALTASLLFATAAAAQAPLPHRWVEVAVDSGPVENPGAARVTLYRETVRVEGATWLRLFFADAKLGGGSVLRLTSLADGAVQHHTAKTLAQWRGSSAFFNGDAVQVELLAEPGAGPSRVRIAQAMAGEPPAAPETICFGVDDRTPSTDDRAARAVPVGCTTWLIDDAQGCFLTAGHCLGAGFDVIEFDVPPSNANGSINHPPPEDQYAVDPASVQGISGGIGNDWGYLGAFPNTETDLTPLQAQATTHVLGTPPGVAGGETLRVTGYGLAPGVLSQVQQTHTGPLTFVGTTSLQYQVDTTGGNSGSAVVDETSGEAIGIHTHGGCNAGGGANAGTSLLLAGLQSALAAPAGVCGVDPEIFTDGFESGDTSAWSATVGG